MLTTCSCGKKMAAIKDYLVVESLVENSGNYKRTTTYTQEVDAGIVRVGLCKDCLKAKAENWLKETEETKCRTTNHMTRIIMLVVMHVIFAGFAVLFIFLGNEVDDMGVVLFGLVFAIIMDLAFNLILHSQDVKHVKKYNLIKNDMEAIASGKFEVRRVSEGIIRLLHEHLELESANKFGMLVMDGDGRINTDPDAKPERRLKLKLNYKGYNGTPPVSHFIRRAIPEDIYNNPLYSVYRNCGLEPPHDIIPRIENGIDGFFSESYNKFWKEKLDKAVKEMNKK
jgi:hypothetical protein